MSATARHQLCGVVYTDTYGVMPPNPSLLFWLFHRSKKVWFRIPEQHRFTLAEVSFSYKGRLILYKGDIADRPMAERSALASRTIVWGKRLGIGWGDGPQGTNFYLSIWTRWSLVHPAQCHPERFAMSYRGSCSTAEA